MDSKPNRYVLEYVNGIRETFVYMGSTEAFGNIPSFNLFNGEITRNTISRKTIENILLKENGSKN